MQVLGKHDDRIDRKRAFTAGNAKSATQGSDVIDKGVRTPVGKREHEEVRAAGNEISTILHYRE